MLLFLFFFFLILFYLFRDISGYVFIFRMIIFIISTLWIVFFAILRNNSNYYPFCLRDFHFIFRLKKKKKRLFFEQIDYYTLSVTISRKLFYTLFENCLGLWNFTVLKIFSINVNPRARDALNAFVKFTSFWIYI